MTQQMDGKTVFSMTLVRHRDGQEKHVLSAMGAKGAATDEQKKAYAEEFEKLDAKARGKTTKPGYVKSRAIADEAKAIFKKMDKNGDAKLTPDEFLAGSKITDAKKATLAFHRFDRDADGAITLEEFGNTCLEWALGG
jgi:Ca2+-binding EF-hand superfamily protein